MDVALRVAQSVPLMHEGRVLATDTPNGLIAAKGAASLEDAFISFLEQDKPAGLSAVTIDQEPQPANAQDELAARKSTQILFSPQRLFAQAIVGGISCTLFPGCNVHVTGQGHGAEISSQLGEDAKDAETKVVDEASFKATFPAVQKNCGGCHETYRLKKQQ